MAVLGRRFSDKMEHVPIKKRKYNFRSPSPPPQTPSRSKASQHASGGRRVHMSSPDSALCPPGFEGKVSINGKLDFREDFSGIEILAEAACSGNFDFTITKPVEESDCRDNGSTILKEETRVSLETTNISKKDTVIEDRVAEVPSIQETTYTEEQKSPHVEDNKILETSASSCNGRLHWDLNVEMDDWQQPSDPRDVIIDSVEGSSKDNSETLNVQKSDETGCDAREADVRSDDMVNKLVSSESHSCSSTQEITPEAGSGLVQLHDECRKKEEAGIELSAQIVSSEVGSTDVPSQNNTAMARDALVSIPEGEKQSDLIEEKVVCVENVQVEEHDVASPFVPVSDEVITHEANCSTLKIDGKDPSRLSEVQNDTSEPQEVQNIKNCQPSSSIPLPMETSCAVEEACVSHGSRKCDDECTSTVPLEEAPEGASSEERDSRGDEAVPFNLPLEEAEDNIKSSGDRHLPADEAVPSPHEMDTSVHVSEEGVQTSSGSPNATMDAIAKFTPQEDYNDYAPSLGEIDHEEPDDKICVSDIADHHKGGTICMENSRELQAGYDSQFEDGELRETGVVHCWDDNEGDCPEIDQVDYESECDGDRMSISETEGSENKMRFENGSGQGCDVGVAEKIVECDIGDANRDHITSLKMRHPMKDTVDSPKSRDFSSKVVGSRDSKGSLSSETVQRSG